MRRREFVALASAVVWGTTYNFVYSGAVRAKQPDEMRRVGLLMSLSEDDPEARTLIATFRQELEKLGWSASRNVRIDLRWSAGDAERIRTYGAELVALQAGRDRGLWRYSPRDLATDNRAPCRSYLWTSSIQSEVASSTPSRGRAAMLPVFLCSTTASPASG